MSWRDKRDAQARGRADAVKGREREPAKERRRWLAPQDPRPIGVHDALVLGTAMPWLYPHDVAAAEIPGIDRTGFEVPDERDPHDAGDVS